MLLDEKISTLREIKEWITDNLPSAVWADSNCVTISDPVDIALYRMRWAGDLVPRTETTEREL